jgi:hypothetical protein
VFRKGRKGHRQLARTIFLLARTGCYIKTPHVCKTCGTWVGTFVYMSCAAGLAFKIIVIEDYLVICIRGLNIICFLSDAN